MHRLELVLGGFTIVALTAIGLLIQAPTSVIFVVPAGSGLVVWLFCLGIGWAIQGFQRSSDH